MAITFNAPAGELLAQQIKTKTIKAVHDDYANDFFTGDLNKKYPVKYVALLNCYFLLEEAKKTEWKWWETLTRSPDDVEQCFTDYKDYMQTRANELGWSGFKIVTMFVDMLNVQASLEKAYCYEYHRPVNKVYINGPKKTKPDFLAKKGGQYKNGI